MQTRKVVKSLFLVLLAASSLPAGSGLYAQQKKLDVTNFVVVGEGLAAGLADMSLTSFYQEKNFAVQMARQMNTAFPQPLIQAPGIGSAPGFPALPVRIPGTQQTTVRESATAPNLFVFNLSVPGFRVTDTLTRKPVSPLVHEYDSQQTVTNLIIGFPGLLLKGAEVWTQLEYARQMRPTFVVVELGYTEAVEAAVKGDPSLLPDVATFRTNYGKVLTDLRATFAEVLALTIPDPMETAYFTTPESATAYVGAPASILRSLYKLGSGDLITVQGLIAIGNQLESGVVGPLPSGSVVTASAAAQITARVRAMNTEIAAQAQSSGSVVHDLAALFTRVKSSGIAVGTRQITADYLLGGFYSLNGTYPGIAGQALIANDVLATVNKTYSKSFGSVNVEALLPGDPAAANTTSSARPYTLEQLRQKIPNLTQLLSDDSPAVTGAGSAAGRKSARPGSRRSTRPVTPPTMPIAPPKGDLR
jgi:hypothetical protein